jgi:hypothetical protein
MTISWLDHKCIDGLAVQGGGQNDREMTEEEPFHRGSKLMIHKTKAMTYTSGGTAVFGVFHYCG